MVGEYALNEHLIQDAWKYIRSSIGEVPIIASELKAKEPANTEGDDGEEHPHKKKGPTILPDGTYATESALTADVNGNGFEDETKHQSENNYLREISTLVLYCHPQLLN